MWWGISIALLGGGLIGWRLHAWLRGGDRRMLDELYTRKVKLAEDDRDKAVNELNANLVEMTTFGERFTAKDAEIAKLRAETGELAHQVQGARREQETARDELARGVTGLNGRDPEAAHPVDERVAILVDERRLQHTAEDH